MDTPRQDTTHADERKQRPVAWRWLSRLFRLCIALIVIGASVAISYYWMLTPPITERRPRGPEAVLVETTPVTKKTLQIEVRAMGTVTPATHMQLAARVSGQIIEIDPDFLPGGRVEAGRKLVQIDPKDYELAVWQQEGNLTRAESDVRLEMGQQSVAHHEYTLLQDVLPNTDIELLLRKPQLAAKEAAVEITRATLEKAQLDLERTTIKAPFNAFVLTRNVDLGSYVSPGTSLATLVGSDEFWVETSVPVDELQWITLPDETQKEGSPARIYHSTAWGAGVYRTGRVIKLLPDLEPRGRMARILVAVEQPLNFSDADVPPLLLDSFVRVAIEGDDVDNVVEVPRTAFHEDKHVWIMLPDNTLDIRNVDIVWGTSDVVYVSSGLNDGEQMVTSNLAAPVPAMPLRTADMQQETRGSGGGGQGGGSARQGSGQ